MPDRMRSDAHAPTMPSRVGARCGGRSPDVVGQLAGEGVHVGAPVRLLGQLLAQAARCHRATEHADLAPRVVEVVLARDVVTGCLEHAAQQVAHERAPGVADRQRPGRVGRDELHVEPAGTIRHEPAEGAVSRARRVECPLEGRIGDAHVEEARRRDLDARAGRRLPPAARLRWPLRWRPADGAADARASWRGWRQVAMCRVRGVLDLHHRRRHVRRHRWQGVRLNGMRQARSTASRAGTEGRRGGFGRCGHADTLSGSAVGVRSVHDDVQAGRRQQDLTREARASRGQRRHVVVLLADVGHDQRRAPPWTAARAASSAVMCIAPGSGSSTPQNASHSSVSPGRISGSRSPHDAQSPLYDEPRCTSGRRRSRRGSHGC